eukprot:2280489-Heterocapsa_arctica.AAC.1
MRSHSLAASRRAWRGGGGRRTWPFWDWALDYHPFWAFLRPCHWPRPVVVPQPFRSLHPVATSLATGLVSST